MARPCTICENERRDEIDRALVSGGSIRTVAATFGASKDAIQRHKQAHITPALHAVGDQLKAAASQREGAELARSLLERIESLVAKIERLADSAEVDGKASQLLAAADRLDKLYRLIGNMTGELDDRAGTTVNVLASPEVARLVAVVIEAVPVESRELVSARLSALEVGQ